MPRTIWFFGRNANVYHSYGTAGSVAVGAWNGSRKCALQAALRCFFAGGATDRAVKLVATLRCFVHTVFLGSPRWYGSWQTSWRTRSLILILALF